MAGYVPARSDLRSLCSEYVGCELGSLLCCIEREVLGRGGSRGSMQSPREDAGPAGVMASL